MANRALGLLRRERPRHVCQQGKRRNHTSSRSGIIHRMFRSRDKILLAVYSVGLDDSAGGGGRLGAAGRTEERFECGAEGHYCMREGRDV